VGKNWRCDERPEQFHGEGDSRDGVLFGAFSSKDRERLGGVKIAKQRGDGVDKVKDPGRCVRNYMFTSDIKDNWGMKATRLYIWLKRG